MIHHLRVSNRSITFWLALGVLSTMLSLFFSARYIARVMEGM